MKFLKTGLAVLSGFVLGAMLYHPQPIKASNAAISVKKAVVGSFTSINGSNVVGFSCAGTGDEVQCYIASQ